MIPTVAIVGRPNVGKSSLFNRLVGRRVSIVDPTPGVTRDRIEGIASWRGRTFHLLDTGGMDFDTAAAIKREIHRQVDIAVKQADVLLFLVDAADGPLPLDQDIFARLRLVAKPIVVAANKTDNERVESGITAFYQFGVEKVFPISALHGRGVGDLLDAVVSGLPQLEEKKPDESPSVHVAIIGKPNVGKSSFVNALLQEPRMIVDDMPGTTRDAVDVKVRWEDTDVLLTDTAGIRRKKKWEGAPEFYSVARAQASVRRAQVVILILDAMEGISQQDRKLASLIEEEGKGMVICLNKWDLVHGVDTRKYAEAFFKEIPFASHVPLVYASALKNTNVGACLSEALRVHQVAGKTIPTKRFNQLLEKIQKRQAHPLVRGRRIKIYFGAQTGSYPPRFTLFVNDSKGMEKSYLNYLRTRIRDAFGFDGVPIRFELKNRR